jgi:3-dehydroquinate dehydratase-1
LVSDISELLYRDVVGRHMDLESFTLAATTAELADATDPVVREHADAVEFRLDLATEPLVALDRYEGDLPIIATNRVEWEGGGAPDDQARLDILEQAAAHDAVEAVDIELAAVEEREAEETLAALGESASTIVSVHDFDRTPPESACRSLLEDAVSYGDVGKLATTARDTADVLPLLGATRSLSVCGNTVATMAMGEAGQHSRAVAPIYGSVLGYAPIDPDEETAPGQYDLATLATLLEQLGVRGGAR